MRLHNCRSDSLGLEILHGWIMAGVLAIGLLSVSECTVQPVHAEFYVDVAGGITTFIPTIEDGTWWQQGLPHKFDTTAFAWRAGVGYRFNARWSVQANYVNLGTVRINAAVVPDGAYDNVAHKCLQFCDQPLPTKTSDAMQGFEVSATRTWQVGPVSPFLRGGAALMFHRLTLTSEDQDSPNQLKYYGRIPMVLVGGGLCWKQICLDETYYHGLGGQNCLTPCGLPVAKEALVSLISFKIPLN